MGFELAGNPGAWRLPALATAVWS